MNYWSEDALEPRYGRVVEVLAQGVCIIEGCSPREGDVILIVGSGAERSVASTASEAPDV